jgi:nucleoside-diphosphate-sugar epimerase
VTTPSLDAFLAQDFERIGEPVLTRAMAIHGRRLILSGATGFFGKNLIALLAHLQLRGARFAVSAISRDPARFFAAEPWAAKLPWLELHRADVREAWPIAAPHDLLLHAATDTHASRHQDLQAVFDDIVAGTRQALSCAACCGVQRLLLTGSGAQYGTIVPDADGSGVGEDSREACDPMQPGSAYGEGKRVAELLATLNARSGGAAVIATRCFAFVGPGLPSDGHYAIGNFIGDALAARPIRLTSAGTATRSYLYGADLALWLLLALLEAPGGSTINVGGGEASTVKALAERVRDLVAPGLEVSTGPPHRDEPRSFYVPSLVRARALGLEMWTPLDLAITRTAAWYRHAAKG